METGEPDVEEWLYLSRYEAVRIESDVLNLETLVSSSACDSACKASLLSVTGPHSTGCPVRT